MRVERMWQSFGARVEGCDLASPMSAADSVRLRDLLDEHAVVAFPAQWLDDAALQAVSLAFGDLDMSYQDYGNLNSYKTKLATPKAGGIALVTNVDATGRIIAADDERRVATEGSRRWHTDLSFLKVPNGVTLLACREAPPVGGQTEFADMYAAWEALPPARQAELDGLTVIHDWTWSRAKIGYHDFTPEERAKFPPMPQPLVRANPRTGRRHLYLASHASHIAGWPIERGRALVDELMAHATQPEFTGAYHWAPGDLAIWDNATTMHRATPFPDTEFRRVMARIGISEPGPIHDHSAVATTA